MLSVYFVYIFVSCLFTFLSNNTAQCSVVSSSIVFASFLSRSIFHKQEVKIAKIKCLVFELCEAETGLKVLIDSLYFMFSLILVTLPHSLISLLFSSYPLLSFHITFWPLRTPLFRISSYIAFLVALTNAVLYHY